MIHHPKFSSEDEEDLDELYPLSEEPLIAVTGSVLRGFKFWGPFTSMKQAVKWAQSKELLLGNVSIVYLKKPE
tara:strand:+ start:12378 stop:12596 length:219 start_codon:yes stop_codon:yes gene_type:complete